MQAAASESRRSLLPALNVGADYYDNRGGGSNTKFALRSSSLFIERRRSCLTASKRPRMYTNTRVGTSMPKLLQRPSPLTRLNPPKPTTPLPAA